MNYPFQMYSIGYLQIFNGISIIIGLPRSLILKANRCPTIQASSTDKPAVGSLVTALLNAYALSVHAGKVTLPILVCYYHLTEFLLLFLIRRKGDLHVVSFTVDISSPHLSSFTPEKFTLSTMTKTISKNNKLGKE